MAKSAARRFAIGVDYGTNSVRALIVDVATGEEVATHVFNYPSGEAGILLDPKDPNLARQNPADYIEGFYKSVKATVRAAGKVPGFSPASHPRERPPGAMLSRASTTSRKKSLSGG